MLARLTTVVITTFALCSCEATPVNSDASSAADAAASDSSSSADTAGAAGAALCQKPGSGYKCLASGCGGGSDWSENGRFESADGADTAEFSLANSGGNGLDWTLSLTHRDDKNSPQWLFSMVVPKLSTDVTASKFVELGGMSKAIKAGSPFVVFTALGKTQATVPSGSVKLTTSANCASMTFTYDITLASGDTVKGSSTVARKACAPCQ